MRHGESDKEDRLPPRNLLDDVEEAAAEGGASGTGKKRKTIVESGMALHILPGRIYVFLHAASRLSVFSLGEYM